MRPINGLWNGEQVKYRPGTLSVAMMRHASHKAARQIIEHHGGYIIGLFRVYEPGIFEVSVIPTDTLRLAKDLQQYEIFRYVEPDIIRRRQND